MKALPSRSKHGGGEFYLGSATDVEEWFIQKLRRSQVQEEEEEQTKVNISYPASWSDLETGWLTTMGLVKMVCW